MSAGYLIVCGECGAAAGSSPRPAAAARRGALEQRFRAEVPDA